MNQIEINKIDVFKTWKGGKEIYQVFISSSEEGEDVNVSGAIAFWLNPSQMKELKEKINKLDI